MFLIYMLHVYRKSIGLYQYSETISRFENIHELQFSCIESCSKLTTSQTILLLLDHRKAIESTSYLGCCGSLPNYSIVIHQNICHAKSNEHRVIIDVNSHASSLYRCLCPIDYWRFGLAIRAKTKLCIT